MKGGQKKNLFFGFTHLGFERFESGFTSFKMILNLFLRCRAIRHFFWEIKDFIRKKLRPRLYGLLLLLPRTLISTPDQSISITWRNLIWGRDITRVDQTRLISKDLSLGFPMVSWKTDPNGDFFLHLWFRVFCFLIYYFIYSCVRPNSF